MLGDLLKRCHGLWRHVGSEVADDEATAGRVIALFRLGFLDTALVTDALEREPVYLILAMTPDRMVRMKPQNLLTGLPIRHPEAVG